MRWPTSHKIRRFVAVLLGLGVIGSASGIAYARLTDLPDDAAFRYQGRVVTEQLLDDRVQVLSALYGVQRPSGGKDAEEFDRDAAKSMAVSLVLENAAAERDIVISDKTAQDQLDKLIDAQLTGGREAFVEFLSSQGISEQDVLDEIKRQMATSKLVEKVTTDVPTVGDDEVRAAYQDHRDRMVTPEARHLLNIVVASRTDAFRVAKLARRTGFRALAATWSRDASTRDQGGDLGTLTADQLEASYAEAAFGTRLNGIYGPVRTQYGWNVGKVVAIRASEPLSFDQVERELRAELQNRARLDVWRDYLGRLLEDAHVEYAAAFEPDDPTAPPAELPE